MLKACKKCRRENEKLLLKGERCLSPKCAIIKRPYAPGQHGQSFQRKSSEYGKQLREKQKAKKIYGISETQFSNYVSRAGKIEGNNAENLLKLLEGRLDNIVYRCGWASSRSEARQLVSHRHFLVNSKKVNIPSYSVKINFTIEPADKSKYKEMKSSGVPTWINLDAKKGSATIMHAPIRDEIDTAVYENLIIEYYSR